MTDPAARTLVFLDVDGPLIPFGGNPDAYTVRCGISGNQSLRAGVSANPLLHRLDPGHGSRLMALGCDVVWATSWMSEANEVIGPVLGLPVLPVVDWDESCDEVDDGLHWKTRALVGWAAGRPFIWIDDEITDADRGWVAAHHQAAALLYRVDARVGLTVADFAELDRWLEFDRNRA